MTEPVFQSRVQVNSQEFQRNRADMNVLVAKVDELRARAAALSEKSKGRFEKRGQLLPRQRLSRLLDPGSPFLELHNMAGFLVDDEDPDTSVPGASTINGIGFIAGVRCMIVVNDSGINAGAMTTTTSEKTTRAQDIALQQKLPFVNLVESAGADLLKYEVEMWMAAGGSFARLARLSAAGIPTITILHGLSVAGGAYMPGMSDYVIGVKNNGMAALAGPALLKSATGEEADNATLGGSEMHSKVSGLVEYLAEDDAHAISICRDLVSKLDWNRHCQKPLPTDYQEPVYHSDELIGTVPVDYRQAYDAREVVARLVDQSNMLDFKPGFGISMVCLQAKIMGMPVGVLCNNGPIDPAGANKAAQFIQLCDQADIPLVFLQNITGYMVGTEYEQAGMVKHGSKMIQAVTNARVPKITMMIGASFGAGNYGMCGKGYDPDFVFSWPNIQIGVMGGEQAAKTMSEVFRAGAKRKGISVDEEQIAQQEAAVIHHYNKQSDAFYTSGRLLDDGIIDPRDTRRVLGMTLQTCWEARSRKLFPNTFGVGRM